MKFEFVVELDGTVEEIWKSIRTFRAVNGELFPLMRMTCPKRFRDMPFEEYPVGEFAFRSLVLFLGVIPMEMSRARLMSVDPRGGFLENSRMLLAKSWIHKRTLTAKGGSCLVRDELEIIPRSILFAPLFPGFVRLVFWNRRRKLKRKFNNHGS